jgi:membrane protease subunit HflK
MESVMAGTNTVMIDVKAGNNMMYLPLDKIIKSQQTSVAQPSIVPQNTVESAPQPVVVDEQPALRTSTRGRDSRGR